MAEGSVKLHLFGFCYNIPKDISEYFLAPWARKEGVGTCQPSPHCTTSSWALATGPNSPEPAKGSSQNPHLQIFMTRFCFPALVGKWGLPRIPKCDIQLAFKMRQSQHVHPQVCMTSLWSPRGGDFLDHDGLLSRGQPVHSRQRSEVRYRLLSLLYQGHRVGPAALLSQSVLGGHSVNLGPQTLYEYL